MENSWISEATKERVWKAAKELGYRPHPAARLLASRRGHYVAIVTNRLDDSTLLESIQRVVPRILEGGYLSFIIEVRDVSQSLYDNIEALADGVVFIGGKGKEFYERVSQLAGGVAAVVSTAPMGSHFAEFVWDEDEGFDRILDHLDSLGHRHVALLGGAILGGNRGRRESFQAACRRRGWDGLIVMSEDEKDRIQAGRRMAVKLLKEHPEVTAVVGRNIEFSVGALAEVQRQGVRVPEDLSVVSYADSWIAAGVWPAVTALRTPVQEASVRAVETVLAMLNGQAANHEVTVLPTEMVLRESTAPPRRI